MPIWLLCFVVFGCRIIDVSLGTLRTVQIVKGKTLYACIVGFIEVLIWFLVVRQALNTNASGIWVALSYSLGFATGTYIGSLLAKVFVQGSVQMQVITSQKMPQLIDKIRDEGYAVTSVNVNGSQYSEEKEMLFIEIDSKHAKSLRALIISVDPKAFIIVHESKEVFNGYFSKKK